MLTQESIAAPARDCVLCPRLAAYRAANQAAQPRWFNGPVPSFGPASARFLVVGMAPGVKGANRTGRPFTGDYAGEPDDGVELHDCRIANAVRCAPPANLPEPKEVTTCNRFLAGELQGMPNLRIALALGVLAHAATLKACGIVPSRVKFQHGAVHTLPDGLLLANSYHVSRYNTSTRRLTTAMFEAVMFDIAGRLHRA
jgi:uracil-DNA glycosylase family 4